MARTMEVANKNDGGAPPFPAKSKNSEKAAGVPAQVAPRQWPRPAKVVPSANHRRSGSFQRWMNQVQRAWSWVPPPREEGLKLSFNPEVLVNQKRQWYRLHSRGVVCCTFLSLSLTYRPTRAHTHIASRCVILSATFFAV